MFPIVLSRSGFLSSFPEPWCCCHLSPARSWWNLHLPMHVTSCPSSDPPVLVPSLCWALLSGVRLCLLPSCRELSWAQLEFKAWQSLCSLHLQRVCSGWAMLSWDCLELLGSPGHQHGELGNFAVLWSSWLWCLMSVREKGRKPVLKWMGRQRGLEEAAPEGAMARCAGGRWVWNGGEEGADVAAVLFGFGEGCLVRSERAFPGSQLWAHRWGTGSTERQEVGSGTGSCSPPLHWITARPVKQLRSAHRAPLLVASSGSLSPCPTHCPSERSFAGPCGCVPGTLLPSCPCERWDLALTFHYADFNWRE